MDLGCAIKEKLIERAGHWILSLVRGGCLLEVEILGCEKRSVGSYWRGRLSMCAIEENGSKGGCVVVSGERIPC